MTQVSIDNGDLKFIFKEIDESQSVIYKLDNGAEVEFYNDDFVSLILPNFQQQLGHQHINSIELEDICLRNEDVLFTVVINEQQKINGKVNISSLQ